MRKLVLLWNTRWLNEVTIAVKAVLKILLIVIIVVSILFLLLLSPFIAADFLGRIQNNKIRNEIFDYVLENQAELEQSISGGYKNFVYTTTGLTPTVSAEYGLFYSTSNNNGKYGYKYKTGYRMDAYLDDDFDWYYEERICENWYYYEIHDG